MSHHHPFVPSQGQGHVLHPQQPHSSSLLDEDEVSITIDTHPMQHQHQPDTSTVVRSRRKVLICRSSKRPNVGNNSAGLSMTATSSSTASGSGGGHIPASPSATILSNLMRGDQINLEQINSMLMTASPVRGPKRFMNVVSAPSIGNMDNTVASRGSTSTMSSIPFLCNRESSIINGGEETTKPINPKPVFKKPLPIPAPRNKKKVASTNRFDPFPEDDDYSSRSAARPNANPQQPEPVPSTSGLGMKRKATESQDRLMADEDIMQNAKYLTNWIPRFKRKKFILEGDLLDWK